MDHSATILESWKANAENWIATIDNNEIESRKLVTNAAILNAISQYHKGAILDIGCGEGWLTRSLLNAGYAAQGIDAIESLVNNAIEKGGANFLKGSYADIASGKVSFDIKFDSAVINFALIDKRDTEQLLRYMPTLIKKGGFLFIQTLHPLFAVPPGGYITGWKEGSWAGLKQHFVLPYQWYFRTLQDWWQLFSESGLSLVEIKEPQHPEIKTPLSILFILKVQ